MDNQLFKRYGRKSLFYHFQLVTMRNWNIHVFELFCLSFFKKYIYSNFQMLFLPNPDSQLILNDQGKMECSRKADK
jgi:hypothetical protein